MIAIHFILLIFLAFLCYRKGKTNVHPFWYWLGLTVKLVCGWMIGYIYLVWLQSGDTMGFYHQALEFTSLARNSWGEYIHQLLHSPVPDFKGEARTIFFSKIISIFLLISDDNYWVAAMWLSFINFLACWHLVRVVSGRFPQVTWAFYGGFMLLPSAVLWSSGVMKESIAYAALFYLFAVLFKYHYSLKFRWWELLFTYLSLMILVKIKYYLAAMVVPAMILLLVHDLITDHITHFSYRMIIWSLVILLCVPLTISINWNLHLDHLPESIYQNYQLIRQHSPEVNALAFDLLTPDWTGLLQSLPASIVAGLFRPFPWEGHAPNWLYGIENLLVLILIMVNIYGLIKRRQDFSFTILIFFSLGYIIILASFLPLVAPNFGTLARYRSAFTPLLFSLLMVFTLEKIRTYLRLSKFASQNER